MNGAEELSARLRAAEAAHAPIEPLDGIAAGDVDAAYAVQQASVAAWTADGRVLVGRKIGLTNPRVQQQLGVDQPDFGALFADMRHESGAELPADLVLQARIETEMAVVLGAPLTEPDLDQAMVQAAIGEVRAAFEIVGSRIRDWRISIVDTIADNASSGAFVLATTGVDPGDFDFTRATMRTTRTRDGVAEDVSSGSGADCLGSPVAALRWLAREMIRRGTPLAAGDIVLTGALGPMVSVAPGDAYAATIDGVGAVQVSFT